MRVFDFDNTIYDGESMLDFYLFSIKYNPKVIKYLFAALFHFAKYKLGRTTLADLEKAGEKYAENYAKEFDDLDKLVSDFWDKHMKKLKSWYKPEPEDVIVTASFNIIMDELCRRLGIENCICSVFNRETRQVEHINFHTNKKQVFQQIFGESAKVDSFYTDNSFDAPMIEIAQHAYIVKGDSIKRVK